ncbi:glycosyltransferase family 90 protein [Cucurbitaria berberidis CBS 394.84]|uniref:Glycosyltransferase family 90 protein n=1 Tax=Cucurbitaria berberidis CBS 394.84 TaxID=1168544 RepID=A0A9P4GPX6_9PLEO|nr:glycosyltransferase family 90 protein [Cucurbitaria berberidis CBS 394.84]KAF1849632.1 glycosyltransferase family 90 protein [Cucurbitaria berberidis CBS 394.84]
MRRYATMRIPTAWRTLWYLVSLTGLVLVGVVYTLNWTRGEALTDVELGTGTRLWEWSGGSGEEKAKQNGEVGKDEEKVEQLPDGVHAIDHLLHVAEAQFKTLLDGRTTSLHDAAAAYRKNRLRHPPPGFEAWYHYAVEQNSIVIEEFWDQIYHDLAPFWSIEPVLLRKQAHVFSPKISIRNGKVEAHTYNVYPKLDMWADMLRTLADDENVTLPDMDIPFNVNDEPALLVPWETVDTAVSLARPMLLYSADVATNYTGMEDISRLTADYTFDPKWLGPRLTHPDSHLGPRPLWSLVRPSCPPGTPARHGHVFDDIWGPEGETSEVHSAAALLPVELPGGTLKGYAQNWTHIVDACQQPNLQGLHGAFVAPTAMKVATKLFPLFGDTKLSMSNEILIPGAMEWNLSASLLDNSRVPWEEKANKIFWRGPATEGHDPARYWQRFHRHRLVSMLNATHVEIAEASIHTGNESTVGVDYANNFRLLPANEYHLKSQKGGQLAGWVNGRADAAFTDLKCDVDTEEHGCPYMSEYFSVAKPATDDEESKYQYAIVVDGDSGDDGGDFVKCLKSEKVTLRASVYRKWYDSRIVPWQHYVPMDNTFVDLYGILEYFQGTHEDAHAHEHTKPAAGMEANHRYDASLSAASAGVDSQSGNEPHDFDHVHSASRKRDGDGHDAAAREIAEGGQEWAAKVLRKEDMLIYVYRLLLEYARIVDDKRERLGWVDDLLED